MLGGFLGFHALLISSHVLLGLLLLLIEHNYMDHWILTLLLFWILSCSLI